MGLLVCDSHGRRWSWRRSARKHDGSKVGEHTLLRVAQRCTTTRPLLSDTRADRVRRHAQTEDLTHLINGRIRTTIDSILTRDQHLRREEAQLEIDRNQLQAATLAAGAVDEALNLLSKHLQTLIRDVFATGWNTDPQRIDQAIQRLRSLT